jgi:hypothetical protein
MSLGDLALCGRKVSLFFFAPKGQNVTAQGNALGKGIFQIMNFPPAIAGGNKRGVISYTTIPINKVHS